MRQFLQERAGCSTQGTIREQKQTSIIVSMRSSTQSFRRGDAKRDARPLACERRRGKPLAQASARTTLTVRLQGAKADLSGRPVRRSSKSEGGSAKRVDRSRPRAAIQHRLVLARLLEEVDRVLVLHREGDLDVEVVA